MIMPTLTRLLVMRIVAKSSFGSASNCNMASDRLFFAEFRDFLLAGSNEKKATSEPDINAETTSSASITKKDAAMPKEKGFRIFIASTNNLSGGSQSASISGKIE